MVNSPNQLTVIMFYIIVTKLLELKVPAFLVLLVLGIEHETNFVEPPLSFRIHFAIFEAFTLRVDPIAQLLVFLVPLWHITCKSGREIGGVLVGVFKMKVKWLTAQTNSQ